MINVNQTYQHLAQDVDRPTPAVLPRFRNQQDKSHMSTVNMSQVWCYEVWHLAAKQLDGCVHTLCWRDVLSNLSWFSAFEFIKNI